MKTKVIRMISPNYGETLPAMVVAASDGKAYIMFKDSEGKHKIVLPDTVKPISIKMGAFSERVQVYFMARDNFLSLDKDHFVVKGIITRELISNIAEWGAAESLIRAAKAKPMLPEGMGGIVIVLGLAVLVWLVLNHLPAGVLPI